MKKIKNNDLTHYFLSDHSQLPASYLASCEKFFRELKNLKLARLTATNVQSCKRRTPGSRKPQAPSSSGRKLQAASNKRLTAAGPCVINRIIKDKL